MKRFPTLLLLLIAAPAQAQLPVIDVAAVTKAVAALVELREQVRLLTEQLTAAQAIRRVNSNHYARFERALTKRRLVPSHGLDSIAKEVEAPLDAALSYRKPEEMAALYQLFDMPEDPLAYDQAVTTRSMGTVTQTVQSLAAHGAHLQRVQKELRRFKAEISRNPEPQQMRDVQASLQVLSAREAILTRQALLTQINLEAVRAAQVLNEKAQRAAVYTTFIGHADWLGDPARYRVQRFLHMPGE